MRRGKTSSSHLRKQMPFALHVAASDELTPFSTLGSSDVHFRKEVLSVRCILESSDRCPNILTVAPPNNLVLRVPCRSPIITVCGRTYHAVCLKSRWGWLGAYPRSTITMELAGRLPNNYEYFTKVNKRCIPFCSSRFQYHVDCSLPAVILNRQFPVSQHRFCFPGCQTSSTVHAKP